MGNSGQAGASTNAPTPTLDLASQFALAERSLEAGQLSQALSAVDAILFVEPDNPDAVALKERIDQAINEMEAAPPPTTSVPVHQPAPPTVPSGPSRSERATALAADASIAIGAGDLQRAQQLIREGRQLDPGNSRWQQLDRQIQRVREQSAQASAAAERQALVDKFASEAAGHLKQQNYEAAIAAYDRALEVDPTNAQLIASRNTAQNAMQQAAAAATVAALAIRESRTQFVAPGQSGSVEGFVEGGNVKVNRATSAPKTPAEVIVEIHPRTVQPGDPYYLRVRIHNEGNRPIGVKALELISTFGATSTGKGMELTPMVQRINPRDTSLIWEVPGTWSEDKSAGSIEAIVTLIGNAKLLKKIEW